MVRRGILAALSFGAMTAMAACDPCSGTASCTTRPQLALEGTIISHLTGSVQSGARVDVVRTGGVGLEADSVSTVTDGNGHWAVTIPAQSAGSVTVAIAVTRKESGSYRIDGQTFSTTERRGEGTIIPTWVDDPHFPYAAEVYFRGPGQPRASGIRLDFVRTTGISFYDIDGAINPDYGVITDAAGRGSLFDVNEHAFTVGDVVGNLIATLPAPFAPDTIHGVRLTSTQLLSPEVNILRFGVGPSLLYVGEVHDRATGKPATAIAVSFHRTSGAHTDPESFNATTDGGGRFLFPLRALGEGAVVGDLTIVPRLGSVETIKNVTLRPHDDDDASFFGVWSVGPYLPWVGLVQIGGRGVAGVQADFHRTGGIQVTPADFTMTSDANGFLHFNPLPQQVGVVEADVVIHSPAPFADVHAHVSLPTVEDDVTGGIIAAWDLDASRASTARTASAAAASAITARSRIATSDPARR